MSVSDLKGLNNDVSTAKLTKLRKVKTIMNGKLSSLAESSSDLALGVKEKKKKITRLYDLESGGHLQNGRVISQMKAN